jgi:hypothetical protein
MPAYTCANCRKTIPEGSVFCPSCGRQLPPGATKTKKSGVALFVFVVICLIIFWAAVNGGAKNSTTSNAASTSAAPPPDPHDLALKNTQITKFSWHKDGFDTIMKANFTIKNDGDVAVKDIQIKCVHSAPSGTVIDENTRTIYEIIPAHKNRTFRDFDMGFIHSQAARSSCRIEDLTLVQQQGS